MLGGGGSGGWGQEGGSTRAVLVRRAHLTDEAREGQLEQHQARRVLVVADLLQRNDPRTAAAGRSTAASEARHTEHEGRASPRHHTDTTREARRHAH